MNCDECGCSNCGHFGFDCEGLCIICLTTDKTECADYFPIEGLEGSVKSEKEDSIL